jgi:medium-chain acyl-[acyl-carrier-protein] hydrolase
MNIKKNFSKEFEIHYYEINQHREATPVTILNYLEDTAIAHSEQIGYGIERLLTDNRAWVLNRWQVEIDRYPTLGEKISIETWPSKFERFYATREYLIRNAREEIIARAVSLWIFINIEKRRPVRIPPELIAGYGLSNKFAIAEPFEELPVLDDPGFSKEFYVRRSDIDTNNHVNNTKYLDWVLESIPQGIYEECKLTSFEIVYKKESGYGLMIKSHSQNCSESGLNSTYLHSIAGPEGVELATAKTNWEGHRP